MAQTLAQILADTCIAEKNHDASLAHARANAQGAEAARKYQLIADFYAHAQDALTTQIVTRIPTQQLGVMVGSDGSQTHHAEVSSTLRLYSGTGDVLSPRSAYHALWLQFEKWAVSQGLRPLWDYRHDGVGIHGWYVLRVEPLGKVYRTT